MRHLADASDRISGRRGRAVIAALLLAALLAPMPAPGREAPARPTGEVRLVETGGLGGLLHLPPRPRPAGLVLLLPDGPDADSRGAPYAEQLLGAGFAVFDTLRGGKDAAAAAWAVAELPAAAGLGPLPVAVLGFGAGARVALRLGPGVAARVLLYPGCDSPAEDDAAGDLLLLLHGGAEAGGAHGACAAFAAWLARGGRPVRRIAYAGASHAWDYPAYGDGFRILLPRPDGAEGLVPALPWPELAAMSAAQAAAFLATALGAGAP